MPTFNQIVLSGTASYPPDDGQAAVPVQFGYSGQYTSVVDSKLVETGAGTRVVPFGSIGAPGAKVAVIEYEAAVGAAPVNLRFNGGTDNFELAPGGLLVWANPSPSIGITALSIVRTGDCSIRVRLFG